MPDIKDLFRPINTDMGIADEAYNNLQNIIAVTDALARTTNQSLYIIDYNRKNFLYVSPNPLFLCEHTPEQVQQMGYAFYAQVVPEEEIGMLIELNDAGFKLFHQQPREARLEMTIEYDFHINYPGTNSMLIHHKLTPILLNKSGNVWLALCVVSLSPRLLAGNVTVTRKHSATHYEYSFQSRKWKELPNIELTQRETDVLRLSVKGYSNIEIAGRLFVDVNTVKFHKKKLFQKLEAENITEAIGIATNLRLI